MGFLGIATPLPWELAVKFHAYVREHGVLQFLSVYDRLLKQDATQRKLLWGEEIEFLICKVRRASFEGCACCALRLPSSAPHSLPRCACTGRTPFFVSKCSAVRPPLCGHTLFAEWMTAEHPPPPLTPRPSSMCMCTPV